MFFQSGVQSGMLKGCDNMNRKGMTEFVRDFIEEDIEMKSLAELHNFFFALVKPYFGADLPNF